MLKETQDARKMVQQDYIALLEQNDHKVPTLKKKRIISSPITTDATKSIVTVNSEQNLLEEAEYWNQYGRDEHHGKCDGDFGWKLIQKWRDAKRQYSETVNPSIPPTLASCHKIQQTRHTATDTFCHFENLYFFHQTKSIGGNARIPQQFHGEFQLELGEAMRNWRVSDQACKETLSGTTLIVNRDDVYNVFHSLANVVNAFQSLLILNIKPKVERVVIIDNREDGPYYSIWSAFSDNVIRQLGRDVCFQKAIFSIPGGSCFIWKDVWIPNYCYQSTLLQAFSRFILSHYDLTKQTRRQNTDPIRITFSSRKLKPNAKPSRRIFNEESLKTIMEQKLMTPTGKHINAVVTLIDLATIPFKEQIALMRNTDVYVGAHGAGMTHLIYLPDEAVVVELFPKGWHQSSMRNLAKNTNKMYIAWQNEHDENIREQNNAVVDEREFTEVMNHAVNMVLQFHLGMGMIPLKT